MFFFIYVLENSEKDKSYNSGSDETTASVDSSTDLSLRKLKRKKISTVLKYFSKSSDSRYAKCITCGKEYKTSGNTSNLADHIKRFHPIFNNADCDDASLPRPSTSFSSNTNSRQTSSRSISPFLKKSLQYDSSSQRKKELDEALAMMIATDFQPFNIVNDVGFRKFIHLLDPKYALPSKFTIKENIMKNLYFQAKNKLKEVLHDINYVAITTDCWTSQATESYLTATCQFINNNFELKTASLSTKQLLKNHTAQNLADTLEDIFNDWNIGNKVACIVTDNAQNMVKMCEILKKNHLPCYAHTLNLAVQENLKLDCIKHILNKCKNIVRFFKNSTHATGIFNEEQKNELHNDTTYPLKLVQEVITRWNSSLNMIRRIIKTKDPLNRTLLKVKKAPAPLSAEEIVILSEIEECLDSFDEATFKVSGVPM